MNRFILASASPRRRELLSGMGIKFDVVVSDTDESAVSKEQEPGLYVQELALIIAADTIVTLDGEILGKPADEADAFDMLARLSGRTHEVYTGYCVMRVKDGYTFCSSVKTEVTFKDISGVKITRYIATGEPMDKAGAYGIQGYGAMLIEKINGDYFNVVGLPVSALADTLENEFNVELL